MSGIANEFDSPFPGYYPNMTKETAQKIMGEMAQTIINQRFESLPVLQNLFAAKSLASLDSLPPKEAAS
jgi:hypothetical protein